MRADGWVRSGDLLHASASRGRPQPLRIPMQNTDTKDYANAGTVYFFVGKLATQELPELNNETGEFPLGNRLCSHV